MGESFDGSILTLSVNGQSKSFIADLDSQSIYDTSGNHGFFYHGLPSMENIMSNPSTSVDEIDALVWRMIRGEVPTCQCPRCTLDHIRFLRLAAHSPPEPLNMNIILACVHIIDSMIPRMTDRIMGNLNELMAMIAGPNDILSQVLKQVWQTDQSVMLLRLRLCVLLMIEHIHMIHLTSAIPAQYVWRNFHTLKLKPKLQ